MLSWFTVYYHQLCHERQWFIVCYQQRSRMLRVHADSDRVISDCHLSEGQLKTNRTYGLLVSEFYFVKPHHWGDNRILPQQVTGVGLGDLRIAIIKVHFLFFHLIFSYYAKSCMARCMRDHIIRSFSN